MGGGGLMQLVAYGAQDIYLTGNPQITFFKVVYRRHTNFAMEAIEQTFNGTANFGKRVTCTISRNGDLIHRIYLQATLPQVTLQASDGSGAQFRWLNYVGHNLINSVELEVGGQRIDKHYGDWLHVWNELTQEPGKQSGYAEMVGNVPELVNLLVQGGEGCDNYCTGGEPGASSEVRNCAPEYTLYIPLQFWFCRNPGLALPLIALQYHEVKINLEMTDVKYLCWDNVTGSATNNAIKTRVASTGLVSASLYVDYIYLDTDERRRFAQVSHEYLIEQLQYTGAESVTSSNNKIKLNFNHPTKELVWVVQRDSFVACDDVTPAAWKGMQPFNYSDWWDRSVLDSGYSLTRVEGLAGNNPVVTAKIQLNGHDRFSEREGKYFNLVQPYQHHTNVPAVGINVYSFALKPEDHQPSGSCNFSRIDNATLLLTLTNNTVSSTNTAKVRVYAVNYNVLRIMSGMGGLAYSN
uniref:Major capsid protein N-terminal domain-containing protein n=1 Tax=viral metagenome TaxID=1070528 RepID=A0A6C0BH73_9ZZZZ